ncbi:M24 family metallopeptidase [Ktedonosporobacter rubrisoli]|nr:M24 family metallopeptidase [Ktedonosporobacter rubrisoli]
MDLERIQQALRDAKLTGWLFYDFRKTNPIAYKIVGLPSTAFYSRRWFYYVPAQGTPTAVISAVEPHVLSELPGKRLIFQTWQDMHAHLRTILPANGRVAMEYSPHNAVPYVSKVDAGTVELIRSFGVEVVSSGNLAQRFEVQLSQAQVESHREAGRRLIAAKDKLLAQLGEDLRNGVELNEYSVQMRLRDLIVAQGIQLPDSPHVAVNANASNPHYESNSHTHSPIRRGDLILLDFWGYMPPSEDCDSVFADYTWMAFAGTYDEIPGRQKEVFEIVRQARDTGIAFARQRAKAGKPIEGREVDDATRNVINQAGYGRYFVHRTGHNIGNASTAVHGNGANVDNFETQDERNLLPNTCCSIEPGIYLPEFGIRSEVDLLVLENDVEVTGVPIQQEIVALLS